MLKSVSIFLGFLILPLLLFSQDSTIDSLQLLLKNSSDKQQRMELFNQIASKSKTTSDILEYAQKAYELAIVLEHNSGKAQSLYLLGKAYRRDGMNDKATEHLELASERAKLLTNNDLMVKSWLELARVSTDEAAVDKAISYLQQAVKLPPQDLKLLRIAYNQLGITYNQNNQFDTALFHLDKAFTLSMENNDKAIMISSLINKGIVYNRRGNYNKSLDVYNQAQEIMDDKDNPRMKSQLYHNIGKTYKQLGHTSLAMTYYKKSLKIKQETNDLSSIGVTYNNIANVLCDEGAHEESLEYYFKAYDIQLATKNKRNIGVTLANIADIYTKLGKHDKALEYGYRSLDHSQQTNNKAALSICLETITKIYMNLANNREHSHLDKLEIKSISEVESMLLRAVALSEQSTDLNNISNTYFTATNFYRSQKKYKETLFYQDKYLATKDSVFLSDQSSIIKKIQANHETENKIKENTFARQIDQFIKQKTQTYLAIALVLIAFLTTAIFYYLKSRNRKKQLEIQHRTIQDQNKSLTLLNKTKDRFFGIIAHDLKSPLIALQGLGKRIEFLLERNDREQLNELGIQVDQTATKLNDLLDNLLAWASLQNGNIPYQPSKINLLDLSDEVFLLFSNLLKINSIKAVNLIDADIYVFADERALNTVFRNLISNAIKFTPAGGYIQLEAAVHNNKVVIQVTDNGLGISPLQMDKLFALDKKSTPGARGEKGTGLGLPLCKELIEVNQGSLAVTSKKGKGSTFTFSIPKS